jgi:hypothetical protein
MKRHLALAAGALSVVSASPCVAAPDDRFDWQGTERRSGAFAGMAVKMPMGAGQKSIPTARLKLGFTQSYRAANGIPSRTSFHGSALELGLKAGEPMLFIGGQSTKSLQRRAQLNGGNSWLYIAGGVAVAAAAAFLIFADDDTNAEPCTPGNC